MDILEERQRNEPSKHAAEDGSYMFFSNASKLLPDYMASHPRK
jgi:hypothetical protein